MNAKHIKAYAKQKLKFLTQFAIYPKEHEKEHMMSLKTEIAIDNYFKSLMDKYL